MDSKGINGSGLAHLWGTARSEFTQKKFVTEVVYPLSSKENYTGVIVTDITYENVDYIKVSDNVYTPADVIGKVLKTGHTGAEKTIQSVDFLSENGSFLVGSQHFVCVRPEDVGKVLNPVEDIIFPEAGTYMWYKGSDLWWEINIAGTYKREVKPQDFGMIVEGEINPANFYVTSLNKNYGEIAEALRLKKDVRLLLNVPLGEDNYMTVLGNAETFSPTFGVIEFGAVIDIELNETDGKQIYHFKFTLSADNTVSTEYMLLSDNSGGQSAVSPTVTITPIDNGHRVTITDVNGEHPPFDVLNGQNGIPATHTWNGTVLTITSASGTSSADLKGDKGDDFTYEDFKPEQLEALKSDIVRDVLDALPERIGTWTGGSY